MKYRPLGNTGLSVSEIGIGCELYSHMEENEIIDLIRYCGTHGMNLIDCWRPNPDVRRAIGKAIKDDRENWYIQGQIGSAWVNGKYLRTRDMTLVRNAFEDLLEEMDTEYIDLGVIHFVDTEEDWDTVTSGPFLGYILELKEKGIIRHIGLSTHSPIIAARAATHPLMEMMLYSVNPAFDLMPADTVLERLFQNEQYSSLSSLDPQRAAVYEACAETHTGITVMKGFGGGRLLDASLSPLQTALTPVQCIHYALTRPAVASVLIGFKSISEAEEALHYEEASDKEKDFIPALASSTLKPYSGQCTYCGHCDPCPNGIDIASVNKYYDLASVHEAVPETIIDHYFALEHSASDCIGCRVCETRCPFHVRIAEKMKKTEEFFRLAQ